MYGSIKIYESLFACTSLSRFILSPLFSSLKLKEYRVFLFLEKRMFCFSKQLFCPTTFSIIEPLLDEWKFSKTFPMWHLMQDLSLTEPVNILTATSNKALIRIIESGGIFEFKRYSFKCSKNFCWWTFLNHCLYFDLITKDFDKIAMHQNFKLCSSEFWSNPSKFSSNWNSDEFVRICDKILRITIIAACFKIL